MIMDTENIRAMLSRKLAELTDRARRIGAELRAPLDDDSAERASAREDDEPLEAVERAALVDIAQIREALTRLANGRYGICLSCGGDIDPRRLEAMPGATLCLACANAV